MTNPTLLTPEEVYRLQATNEATIQPDTIQRKLIATLEAAWAENEKLRDELHLTELQLAVQDRCDSVDVSRP